MISIDHSDAEVQQYFTAMKKAVTEHEKQEIAIFISKMYERNDDYSFGVTNN